MEKVLVNSDRYNGQYVAVKGVDDNIITRVESTPEKALEEAKQKGSRYDF